MPFLILILGAWIIGKLAEKVQTRVRIAKAEKAIQAEINARQAAKDAERANRERIAQQRQTERENAQREKECAAAEKAKQAEKERLYRISQAKREIDYCNSVLNDLNARLDKAMIDLEFAQLANYSGDKLYKAQKPVDDLKRKIYQTENKIEKAYHVLHMCNA